MPKAGSDFDASQYARVADRIALFYQRFPDGRIVTRLVSRHGGEITFMSRVYRAAADPRPAATGWASERIGDGDVNSVACLENTETSAIGRALANLGFTASRNRPSLEEMDKAARERARLMKRSPLVSEPAPVARPVALDADPLQRQANAVHDLFDLLQRAEALGFPIRRAQTLRANLERDSLPGRRLARLERRLRGWITLHRFSLG
jgi:hypothetical protein